MSRTLDQLSTVPSKTNPNLEIHHYCTICHPTAERALCGARLHGIDLGHIAMTCTVCADFAYRCPECGR